MHQIHKTNENIHKILAGILINLHMNIWHIGNIKFMLFKSILLQWRASIVYLETWLYQWSKSMSNWKSILDVKIQKKFPYLINNSNFQNILRFYGFLCFAIKYLTPKAKLVNVMQNMCSGACCLVVHNSGVLFRRNAGMQCKTRMIWVWI